MWHNDTKKLGTRSTSSSEGGVAAPRHAVPYAVCQRERVIDNLLVRIHFIIVMIRWTGLAPWEVRTRSTSSSEGVVDARHAVPYTVCHPRECQPKAVKESFYSP